MQILRHVAAHLVAWECHQIKALVSVRFVQSPETRVVHVLHPPQNVSREYEVHMPLESVTIMSNKIAVCILVKTI